MKWLQQHWRGIWRCTASLLLISGFFCGYLWFYMLAPSRRTLSPEWFATHSQREYWREVQKGIHRGVWNHDDGITVGMYGDKAWAEWIMAHLKPGMSMACIGPGLCHSATSMREITNQDVGDDAVAWLNWWDQNKSKSQMEWIEDGFRQHGLDVKVPPSSDHAMILLEFLGNSTTIGRDGVHRHLKYNAFRCLRDSGFESVAFAVSNRTVSAEIERGLLEYAKMDRRWPLASGVGILPFGVKQRNWDTDLRPIFLGTRFQVAANAIIFGQILLGMAALIWSFKNKKRNAERTRHSIKRTE